MSAVRVTQHPTQRTYLDSHIELVLLSAESAHAEASAADWLLQAEALAQVGLLHAVDAAPTHMSITNTQ